MWVLEWGFAKWTWVGIARDKFGVKAPATTGNENFERYYRVQMNSLEMAVVFIPSLLLASQYWPPLLITVLGLVYLIGRILYFLAYTKGKKRTIPFLMGMISVILYIFLGIIGSVRALL